MGDNMLARIPQPVYRTVPLMADVIIYSQQMKSVASGLQNHSL